ncbi:MAG TPA: hypothetical protein VJX67_00505, partial [Blastocatellia bacterium]|nr:hypothetical protein [Blastocatellia bacterium]
SGATSPSRINTLERDVPTRSRIPFTRLSLHTLLKKKLDFTGRIIYSSATTHYNFAEAVTGINNNPDPIVLDQTLVNGNTKRPNAVGDFAATFYATDKLTFSNAFRVNSFRINGGDIFSETTLTTHFGVPLTPQFINTLAFQFLGLHLYQNTAEANYDFSSKFQVHAGYRFTHRDVDQGNLTVPPAGVLQFETFENNTNTGFFGFRARPVPIWSLYFDFERGSADNVFVRVGNYDVSNVRVRTLIKPTKTLAINASLVTKKNDNPSVTQAPVPAPFGVNISSRIFSTSLDWTPNSKLSLSSGYTYNHLNSDAAIIFFLNFAETQGTSLYFVRDSFFFFNTRVQVNPRLSFYTGFRIDSDSGQGSRTASSPSEIISSFPLHFISPEARFSVMVNKHIDWNAGWQYFDYNEKLGTNQDYRANTAYVSLTLRLNRE